MRNKNSYFPGVLVGGAAAGVLSTIPFINYVNCLFCAWMLLGAGLAVYLVQQRCNDVELGEGAIIGIFAGLICGFIAFAGGSLLMLAGFSVGIPGAGNPEEVLGLGGGLVVMLAMGCAINMLIYPLFGALGGLISAAIFKPSGGGGSNEVGGFGGPSAGGFNPPAPGALPPAGGTGGTPPAGGGFGNPPQ